MSQIDTRIIAQIKTSTAISGLVQVRSVRLESTGDGILATVLGTWQDVAMGRSVPIAETDLQVTCYAKEYANAHNHARDVRRVLERWTDTTGGVYDTLLEDESQVWDGEYYEFVQDYTVYHTT